MKIRTHFVYGKRQIIACGTRGGFITTRSAPVNAALGRFQNRILFDYSALRGHST